MREWRNWQPHQTRIKQCGELKSDGFLYRPGSSPGGARSTMLVRLHAVLIGFKLRN